MDAPFGLSDGTSGVVLTFPEVWPPLYDERLTTLPTLIPGLDIQLHESPPGVLEVWFRHQGERRKVFRSARVDFPLGGEGEVYISWGSTGVQVSIGADDIPADGTTDAVHHLPLIPHLPGSGERSLDDPDADASCESWVAWRRAHLSSDEVPAGRVAKTLDEQLADLHDATVRMGHLLKLLEAGQLYWAGSLAVELRALIHWRERDFKEGPKRRGQRKNIPLLLRLAHYRDLPLPVFAFAPQRALTHDATQFRVDVFTLVNTSGYQRVVDLQQWLSHPALFDPVEGSWGMKDLIASHAETKGPGHYDSGVPSVLELLTRCGVGDMPTSARFLYQVGGGVLALAEHVLERFGAGLNEQRRGL